MFLLVLFMNTATADYTVIDTLSFGGSLSVDGENPTLSGEDPTDGAINISRTPDLYVICTHPNSETMTATWRSNSSGSWETFAVNTSISTGTNITQTNSNFSDYNTTYYWSVNLTDGTNWVNDTYSFTTEIEIPTYFTVIDTLSFGGILYVATADSPPTQSNENPTNGSIEVSREPSLSVYCSDPNLDTLSAYWYWNNSGTWELFAQDLNFASPDTITQTNTNFTDYSSTYYWSVNLTDGNNWTNATYHFTTLDAVTTGNFTVIDTQSFGGWLRIDSYAPAINNVSPTNETTGVSLFPTLTVDVVDYQSDTFTINWSINGSTTTFSGTNSSVTDGTFSQVATFANQTNTVYWWTVNITDSTGNYTNQSFWFITTSGGNWSNYSDIWTFTYAPSDFVPQSGFKATHMNNSLINLTWTTPSNTTSSYIRRQIDTPPTSRTEGTLVINTTNNYYDNNNLDAGSNYYYSIWGYNSTLNVFTSNYNTTDNYTSPSTPYDFEVSDITMNTLDLQWNKGVNSTNSVIIINESGWSNYPTDPNNGTEVYNNTGETYTVEDLVANTTYYFTVFTFNPDSGYWGDANTTVNETTTASAGQPTNLIATTSNSTRMVLTWTKPTGDETVIRMQKGSYPTTTTGTEIYNGSSETYTITGMDPATHYYFTAYGWNGESLSTGYSRDENITKPAPPTNLLGNIDGTTLTVTWNKGVNATRTILANNTASYPTDPQGTDVFYNGTGTEEQVEDVTTVDYYTGWSYALVDGEHLYSEGVELLWGGLEINAYKQTDPSIEILNFTVFITNQDGTETWENTSQNNPTRIDVSDVPNGEDISITVSKDGYYPSTIINDLYENAWYQIDFYLVPSPTGGGDPDEPDYIPPETDETNESENETYAYLYLIIVQDQLGIRVDEVTVKVKKYINTTGEYEEIATGITDGTGQAEFYLAPHTKYLFTLSKENYETTSAWYTPSEDVFTHTFTILPEEIEEPTEPNFFDYVNWTITPSETYHNESITIDFNITDWSCNLSYYYMEIYWENITGSGEQVLAYANNVTTQSCGGSLNFTTNSSDGKYTVYVYIKRAGDEEYLFEKTYYVYAEVGDQWNMGDLIPDLLYWIIAVVVSLLATGFAYKYVGSSSVVISLIVFGFFVALNPASSIAGVPIFFVLILMGIVTAVLFMFGRIGGNNS